MRYEESLTDDYEKSDLAEETDFDLMHRTWALGLLLGFEGTARTPRHEILRAMKKIAAQAQLADGSFYPSRVPWVTARVLIGLAKAGESVGTSETVRRGCEWLKRSYPSGPYRFGTWQSGTGTWNTTLGTTSMCINALVRSGVPTSDSCVRAGTAYIMSKRNEWVRLGQEIDAAFSMETVLATRGQWREISDELSVLLAWVRDREAWITATQLSSESHDESCKVSQIASSLVGIVWDTVKAELPLLLEGITVSINEEDTRENELIGRYIDTISEEVDGLRIRIVDEISTRQSVEEQFVGNPQSQVEKQHELWRARRAELKVIETKFANLRKSSMQIGSIKSLCSDLDLLGTECFPAAWRSIVKTVEGDQR